MTKNEAKAALAAGKRITHELFSDGEWVEQRRGRIFTEDGVDQTDIFWDIRQQFFWENGWEIVVSPDKGKPYQPSNGTEGEGFISRFCERCAHDKVCHSGNTRDRMCGILTCSMAHDISHPFYPKEWVYDENGNGICTAWAKWDWVQDAETGEWNDPPEDIIPDPAQLSIFDVIG